MKFVNVLLSNLKNKGAVESGIDWKRYKSLLKIDIFGVLKMSILSKMGPFYGVFCFKTSPHLHPSFRRILQCSFVLRTSNPSSDFPSAWGLVDDDWISFFGVFSSFMYFTGCYAGGFFFLSPPGCQIHDPELLLASDWLLIVVFTVVLMYRLNK